MIESTRRELLAIGAGAALALRPRPRRAVPRSRPRTRPIVFNSDADVFSVPGAATPAGLIAARFAALEDTQVAAIADCTGQTLTLTHQVRAAERYDRLSPEREARCDAEDPCPTWRADMRALGRPDRLDIVRTWARRHGMEHLWSYRVNDVHDAYQSWELSDWKTRHPSVTLARPGDSGDPDDPRYWWSALDFERPLVREKLLAIVADTLATHRLDGVELDYYRAPLFFRPHLDLEPATARQTALLTRFHRAVRDRAGRRVLAARVPATVERCLHCGIDIEHWLRSGLVDQLRIGGGYMPFTEPVGELVALAHRHGVPAHVCLSASGLQAPYDTVEAWRGAAANALHAGADGIYTFNFFPSPGDVRLREIGRPATLAGRDKTFAIEPAKILQGLTRNAIVQDQALPAPLSARRTLVVGEDVRRARRTTLRIRLADPLQVGAVDVLLNGDSLGRGVRSRETGRLTFDIAPARVRHGGNDVRVVRTTRAANTAVTAIELTAGYRDRPS